MSLRLPKLSVLERAISGADSLEAEIMAEKSAALGRAGRALETALEAYRATEPGEAKIDCAYRAAEAAQALFIQRELMGQRNHAEAIRDFDIPKEVLGKVGARR